MVPNAEARFEQEESHKWAVAYLKQIWALSWNVKQEGFLFVAIHEVSNVLWIVTIVIMLVTRNINDLHLWLHDRMVIIRWKTNETMEFLFLTSVLGFFKEYIVKTLFCASEYYRLLLIAGFSVLLGLLVRRELQFHNCVVLVRNLMEISNVICDDFVVVVADSCTHKGVEGFRVFHLGEWMVLIKSHFLNKMMVVFT